MDCPFSYSSVTYVRLRSRRSRQSMRVLSFGFRMAARRIRRVIRRKGIGIRSLGRAGRRNLNVLIRTHDVTPARTRCSIQLRLFNCSLNLLEVADAGATTIMISTRVKPFFIFFMVVFLSCLFVATDTVPIAR